LRDITKRKEMEEALKKAHNALERKVEERTAQLSKTVDKLRETELRYRTVVDFTYDWEYWAKLDGTMRYISPSCERISGYTPGQFIDNPSLFREIIVPKDQDIWKKHYHDSRKEPKAREIQFRIRSRDGAIRWIEHACQPVIGNQGEILGFRASNRDITRRKEGEIKLQNAYLEIEQLKEQLEADQTYLRDEIKSAHNYENIVGDSDMLKYVLFRAEQIAPIDTTVLILGETGTGKELIARAIHGAKFSIKAQRQYGYFIVKVIIPIFLIVMMSCVVFWIDPKESGTQINVAITMMLTLIAYRFAVGADLPKVSYLTRIDYFILAATFLVFASLIEVVITSTYARVGNLYRARKIDRWARILFPTTFILMAFESLIFRFGL